MFGTGADVSEKNGKRPGFMTTELIVATAILGIIIVGLTASMSAFSSFNEYQWARQRCIAAAQAQLDSITVTGRPVEPKELARLWGTVEVSVSREPGAAQWEGLELVRVTAVSQAGPRRVTLHLSRYIRPDVAVARGE